MVVTIESDAPLPSIPKAAAPPLRTVRRSTIFVSIGGTDIGTPARRTSKGTRTHLREDVGQNNQATTGAIPKSIERARDGLSVPSSGATPDCQRGEPGKPIGNVETD